MKIPYEDLSKVNEPFVEAYSQKIKDLMHKGWFILGEEVQKFEKNFAAYVGTKYCVGVASGLDALYIALKAYDFEKGSEVLVPSNTYIATILAIENAGLKPILVEPRLETYNINPDLLAAKISHKTKAIMVVHLYGKTCEMESIRNFANKHGLKVIEDCAQSHGSSVNISGKAMRSGACADVGAFSFYPTKNLGALGDAGAITTDDEQIAEKIKMLRNYGSAKKYYNEVSGLNSRLDEIQAAFLCLKLERLDEINSKKRALAKVYLENLDKTKFVLPVIQDGYFDVYHIFNVRHEKRDLLKKYLADCGIGTDIHYPVAPIDQVAMRGILDHQDSNISRKIHSTTLSLPISWFHTEDQILQVCQVMNQFPG